MLSDTVRSVAELAGGKPARVVDPAGGVHRVLGASEESPEAALDISKRVLDLQEQLGRLLESQVRVTSSNVAALAVQVEGMAARLDGVLKLVEAAASGQEKFERDLGRLVAIMKMPVEPIYNDKGLIVAGVRVDRVSADVVFIGGVRYERKK